MTGSAMTACTILLVEILTDVCHFTIANDCFVVTGTIDTALFQNIFYIVQLRPINCL